jgi:hypothetical protein
MWYVSRFLWMWLDEVIDRKPIDKGLDRPCWIALDTKQADSLSARKIIGPFTGPRAGIRSPNQVCGPDI